MPRPKGSHDVAPVIRKAFLEAIKIKSRREGKTFSEIMAEWLDEDWKSVMVAVGKYTVQEKSVTGAVKHDHSHKHTGLQETSVWLAETLGAGAEGSPEEPVSH